MKIKNTEKKNRIKNDFQWRRIKKKIKKRYCFNKKKNKSKNKELRKAKKNII